MNVGVIFQPTNKRAAPTTDRALNSRVLLLHLISWSELLRLTGPFLFVSRGKLLRLTRPFFAHVPARTWTLPAQALQ